LNEAIAIYKRISHTDESRYAFEATRALLLLHLKCSSINEVTIDLDALYIYYERLLQLFHKALPFRRKDVVLEIISRVSSQLLHQNTNAESLIIAIYDDTIKCVQVLHCNDIWFALHERLIHFCILQNLLSDAVIFLERLRTANLITYTTEQRCVVLKLEIDLYGGVRDKALLETLYHELKQTDRQF
jgi:hypothetical protein